MFILGMKKPVWEEPNEGLPGGAGEGGEGAAPDASASESGEGSLQDGAPARSSIMDFATKGEGGEPWQVPDGMEVPSHLVGSTAEDTLSKVMTAYKGARQELGSRKKADGTLEGTLPSEIDGYTFDSIEADPENDPVLADLTSEESRKYVDPARQAALEVGIPDAAFAKFMHAYASKLGENGIQINSDPEKQAEINGEAEFEGLVGALGQNGADLALRQMDNFQQKLQANGILATSEDNAEFLQMIGTAKATQIMQKILVAEFGEQAIPPADPMQGAPTQEEAYAAHRAAMQMQPGSDRDDAMANAEAMLEKAMSGQVSTRGTIRSKVM